MYSCFAACSRIRNKNLFFLVTTDFGQWYIELADAGHGSKTEGIHTITMLIAWQIRKERNKNRVYSRDERTAEQVFDGIRDEGQIWIRAGN